MHLERYIYLDTPGIASLYAQLKGEDVVETLLSIEHKKAAGWKLAISAFLGLSGGGNSSESTKDVRSLKRVLRPENMLREIAISLRANNKIKCTIEEAMQAALTNGEPSWFEGRHAFSVPPDAIGEMNAKRSMFFVSGFPPYTASSKEPKISMSASLHHCPEAPNGYLGCSSHRVCR